jgi:hypothetical protein
MYTKNLSGQIHFGPYWYNINLTYMKPVIWNVGILTQRYTVSQPKDRDLNLHSRESLKSYNMKCETPYGLEFLFETFFDVLFI